MSFIRGGETITIKRRSEASRDEWNNKTFSVTTIIVKDALIAVGNTSEPVDPARDAEDASLTLYLPNGTVIEAGDRFVIRGSEWVKDGSAMEWTPPFPTLEGGVVVPVRRRRG
jgi:hypothetical protein